MSSNIPLQPEVGETSPPVPPAPGRTGSKIKARPYDSSRPPQWDEWVRIEPLAEEEEQPTTRRTLPLEFINQPKSKRWIILLLLTLILSLLLCALAWYIMGMKSGHSSAPQTTTLPARQTPLNPGGQPGKGS